MISLWRVKSVARPARLIENSSAKSPVTSCAYAVHPMCCSSAAKKTSETSGSGSRHLGPDSRQRWPCAPPHRSADPSPGPRQRRTQPTAPPAAPARGSLRHLVGRMSGSRWITLVGRERLHATGFRARPPRLLVFGGQTPGDWVIVGPAFGGPSQNGTHPLGDEVGSNLLRGRHSLHLSTCKGAAKFAWLPKRR